MIGTAPITPLLKPHHVAALLEIGVKSARALMKSGAIRSQLYATTGNGREYYRTTFAAVGAYLESIAPTASPALRDVPAFVASNQPHPRPLGICHA